MPISHESPSTPDDAPRYNARACVRFANRTASSPIAPSLRTTDHPAVDHTSNRERGEPADKCTIASGDRASCGAQQPRRADQTKEISYSAVKEEGHGKPAYKSPTLPITLILRKSLLIGEP